MDPLANLALWIFLGCLDDDISDDYGDAIEDSNDCCQTLYIPSTFIDIKINLLKENAVTLLTIICISQISLKFVLKIQIRPPRSSLLLLLLSDPTRPPAPPKFWI